MPENSVKVTRQKKTSSNRPQQEIRPGEFWLVIFEHRPSVVKIASHGKGFFACGQESLYGFTEISAWIRKITIVRSSEDNPEGNSVQ